MKAFDQQISEQLNNSGLIYGGSKKAHYKLALIGDGNGGLYADRVELTPGPAGSVDLIADTLDTLGYEYDQKDDSVVVYK